MPNPLSRRLRRRWLPQALAVLLVVTQIQAAEQAAPAPQPPAAAPQASTPPAAANPAPAQPVTPLPVEQSLKIRALAGNGEQNDMERRVMAPLVVQVLDQNERPIAGADVVFRFPLNGPSATFAAGKTTVTVRTNGGGQAAATNWMANGMVGTFQIHVNATYGNQVGETTISMSNVIRIVEETHKSKAGGWWSHKWVKVAVIGGVAAGIAIGVLLATRGGGSKGGGSTVTISPGPPAVGAPQ
jgi:hypothetical protein